MRLIDSKDTDPANYALQKNTDEYGDVIKTAMADNIP